MTVLRNKFCTTNDIIEFKQANKMKKGLEFESAHFSLKHTL